MAERSHLLQKMASSIAFRKGMGRRRREEVVPFPIGLIGDRLMCLICPMCLILFANEELYHWQRFSFSDKGIR